ncbi:MAG: N-6 DNA methylase [Bacillota bacterium]|nr:N-6 DNA methylase [Bacillota bacterium]
MKDKFIQYVNNIYQLINEPIDQIYKITAIQNCKKKFNINHLESLSKYYFSCTDDNKQNGVVYTPLEIAEFIVKKTITDKDIINNPFIKIVDPACGAGNLIIPCYNYLKEIYIKNIELINRKNNLNLTPENIAEHIILNNLYGYDIDDVAIKVLIIDLYQLGGFINIDNFKLNDFLLEELQCKYDIFISNPPYVGHKSVDKVYSAQLKAIYKEIYRDKGDISYCFFQKSLFNLNKGGKLTFITSRYFLESPSGEQLRIILKELCSINTIVDFYGIRPFKGVGVDPLIIFINNENSNSEKIQVLKPNINKGKNKKEFYQSLFLNKGNNYKNFYVCKGDLNNKGWILRDEDERNIINKIENHSFTTLANVCNSYQGIITGCDKAFIMNKDELIEKEIEMSIVKPWIKSSHIGKKYIEKSDQYLIYSDYIENEDKYPNSLHYIGQYHDKLINRRECRRGVRKWYELQWGRVPEIFENEKIVFPYKSKNNRFALDKGSFFSADVYALRLKENVPFTYDYLLYILNSNLYEFYFKTFAKKLGEDLYEYYPNNLMKLCIPTMIDYNHNNQGVLYNLFELNDKEIEIIENNIN